MQLKLKQRGAALITSLLVMVIVGGIAALIFSRTLNEMQHSRDDAGIVQTLMLARGGANGAGSLLRGPVRDEVEAIVGNRSNTVSRWSFGSGNDEAPAAASVANALKQVAEDLQVKANARFCGQGFEPSSGSATVSVRVYFNDTTVCGSTLPNGVKIPNGRFVEGQGRSGSGGTALQTYALPFVMVSEAEQGSYRRNVVLQGEYRFVVGRNSFARYAYFSNRRKVGSTSLFFTSGEMVDGPVHSNEYLRYSGTPWFGGDVTVAGCVTPTTTACGSSKTPGDYFNSSSNFVSSANIATYCATDDCPSFSGPNGADFAADFVPMPTNNNAQRDAADAKGLLFTKPLSDLKLWEDSNYQYIEAVECANVADPSDLDRCDAPTTTRQFRYGPDLVLEDLTNGTTVTSKFNGVIFSDGGINSLGGPTRSTLTDPASAAPALADFSQITVASTGSVIVTRDLKYATPPCSGRATQDSSGNVTPASCNDLDAQNVLGIYSQEGDVLFGTGDSSTPLDLTVHAVTMSGEGRVGTNNWDNVVNAETELRILGGVIGETVAGFSTSAGGYQRNVTYDQRMLNGFAPPHFPTTGPDELESVFLFSFGQREQVY